MSSSLSILVDNLSEIYSKKCINIVNLNVSLKDLKIKNFLIGVVSGTKNS